MPPPLEDADALWNRLKSDWARKRTTTITTEQFEILFYDGAKSREAVEVAEDNPIAFKALSDAAWGVTSEDSDVRRVWLAVLGDDEVDDLWPTLRGKLGQADRLNALYNLVQRFVEVHGRQSAREITVRTWWGLNLSEEEREGVVRGLLRGGVRDAGFYRSIGFDPTRIAIENGYELDQHPFPTGIFPISNRNEDVPLNSRFESLLADVTMPTDLRDACLRPDELRRVSSRSASFAPTWSAFARAVRRFGHPEMIHEMWHMLRHAPLVAAHQAPDARWSFPIFRFLHLQQILEAPSLANAVRDPAAALVPDVALYLMGRDAVMYQPELRVMRDADRRWRARWAETAGEATATMFLEDAVQLDLATLARIPERANEQTPDFMAMTMSHEPLVFETKGSTQWQSHLSQRRDALGQLGKNGASSGTNWAARGRTFACSLFAAQQGEPKSSLLHVDDPPFGFGHLFGEGGEFRCRREHAVAVLQAARFYEAAESFGRSREFNSEQVELSTFQLRTEENSNQEGQDTFVGHYLPTLDWAHQLGHPDIKQCSRIRMFVGLEQGLFRRLARGQVIDRESLKSETQFEFRISKVGVLPGSRGIYSHLADGAFMAVELK